jgi:hypothetical protein
MKATAQWRFATPYLLLFVAFCSLASVTFSLVAMGLVGWVERRQESRDARQAQLEIRLYQLERPAEILTTPLDP